jgi:acetylornithine deacetylase/succinyl-diaminopimelate desuccinylase-like protein
MKGKEVEILKKLVSLPSFVDESNNEKKVANFIFKYLKQFDFLKVNRQKISKDRWNVFAKTRGSPKLFFAGHMDTVLPSTKTLILKKKNGKIFGLGALDTKGGIATLLATIGEMKDIKNTSFLFYCDEEYSFKGMSRFLEKNLAKVGELGIVIEPTNLKIGNAHRGLIEISFEIEGKRGHAARIEFGINAIKAMTRLLNALETFLEKFSHPVLGKSTLNIAFMHGGLKNGKNVTFQGNIIPDFACSTIEIRSASEHLNAKRIIEFLTKESKKNKTKIFNILIKHDLGSFFVPESRLKNVSQTVYSITKKKEFVPSSERGYGDGQLLYKKKKMPIAYLGPSGKNAHGANEYVVVSSLILLKKIYRKIIEKYQ